MHPNAMQTFGLGLRPQHYQDFLNDPQPVDWLEIVSENFMVAGGKPLIILDRIRNQYPVVMHGVSMSLGSVQGLKPDYLQRLKALADRVEPMWVSDHLCWTGTGQTNLHDLLPLPFTEEALQMVTRNIHQAQDALQRPLVIENVSSYLQFSESEMTEWEFLKQLAQTTGCKLLMDINNWYVNSFNHGFDAFCTLKELPSDCAIQFHLAGHTDNGDHLIDTHDAPVRDEVWQLYVQALEHFGPVATMIERDDGIPPLPDLLAELEYARHLAAQTSESKKQPRTSQLKNEKQLVAPALSLPVA